MFIGFYCITNISKHSESQAYSAWLFCTILSLGLTQSVSF